MIFCNKIPNKKKSSLRKRPSKFAFEVFDSISMIDPEHWNSVANFGSLFLNLPYLSVLENEHPDNMRFQYTIIYNDNAPVAIVYFQIIDFSSESFGNIIGQESAEVSCVVTEYLKRHITNHLIRSAEKINMRLLICGNAFVSGEHGFACVPGIDKVEIYDALADVVYEICKVEKLQGKIAAILIKDFYASSKSESDELKEFKYHDFLVEPNMIVNINWKTFDEYLNTMSKKYRNRAKGIVKKGAELQRKNFSANDIKEHSEQIQLLYNNVHLKASFRMASLSSNYFVEMKNILGDKFNFIVYYYNGKLIGFSTSFIFTDSMEAHFIGLDYEVNKQVELYQNILYDYVDEAINRNFKQLILGRTASEIKSTVGAEAYQLTCYIRHRNSLSNHLIKPFIDSIKPTEWIPRNPFKEISGQEIEA